MMREPAPETVIRSSAGPSTGTDFRSGVMRRDVMVPKKRWPRRLAVAVVILLVLGAGGYVVVRNLLSNSYFVGVNDGGMVTIYQGIPDEIAGFDLRDEAQATDLALDELPSFMQDDVEEGIRADSLGEAEATVTNLESRAEEFNAPEPEPTKTPKKKKNNN
jgi:PPM family protein phosphatase